jgi:hypothetical protein
MTVLKESVNGSGAVETTARPPAPVDNNHPSDAADAGVDHLQPAGSSEPALTVALGRALDALLDEVDQRFPDSRLEHYRELEVARERVTTMCMTVFECLQDRTIEPIARYSESIAQERLSAGLDIAEVQTAFDLFAEGLQRSVLPQLPTDRQTEAKELIATILAAGKDSLARTWVRIVCSSREVREDAPLISVVVESVVLLHPDVPKEVLEEFAEEAFAKTRDARVQGHRLPLAQHDVRDRAIEWERSH